MNAWVQPWAVLGVCAAVLGGLWWLASRARRRGIGGNAMNPIDEVFHPAAHRPHLEIQARDVRALPTEAPGDRRRPPVDHEISLTVDGRSSG